MTVMCAPTRGLQSQPNELKDNSPPAAACAFMSVSCWAVFRLAGPAGRKDSRVRETSIIYI